MDVLRELRIACGLTLKELGEQLGLAESTIHRYETGKREPDIQTLIKIAQYFEVSVDELLGLDPPEQKRQPVPQAATPKIKFTEDWIRKQISATAALYREYRDELKACEQQEAQLKQHMTQLKKLMNIAKGNVKKMEEIINDEQS